MCGVSKVPYTDDVLPSDADILPLPDVAERLGIVVTRVHDLLREGRPGVTFCHVDVSREELERRLAERKGHYMPASLLQSQLDTLEPLQADEPGTVVEAKGGQEAVLAEVMESLHLHAPANPEAAYVKPTDAGPHADHAS